MPSDGRVGLQRCERPPPDGQGLRNQETAAGLQIDRLGAQVTRRFMQRVEDPVAAARPAKNRAEMLSLPMDDARDRNLLPHLTQGWGQEDTSLPRQLAQRGHRGNRIARVGENDLGLGAGRMQGLEHLVQGPHAAPADGVRVAPQLRANLAHAQPLVHPGATILGSPARVRDQRIQRFEIRDLQQEHPQLSEGAMGQFTDIALAGLAGHLPSGRPNLARAREIVRW